MKGKVEQKFDPGADLSQFPVSQAADSNSEYVIGDLHANAHLMLYFLQREGIFCFSEEDFKKQSEVYHKDMRPPYCGIYSEDRLKELTGNLGEYVSILRQTKFNSVKKIHFIGDTLADRGNGDHFILYNYRALAEKHIDFDVVLSNHDLEFLIAYFKGPEGSPGNLDQILYSTINTNGQVNSTLKTKNAAFNGLIERSDIHDLVKTHYLPHINLISYTLTETGITLMTHAPVDFEIIQCAANALKVLYNDATPQALASTIDAINDAFRKQYIQTGKIVEFEDSNRKFEPKASRNGISFQHIPQHPLSDSMGCIIAALTWNRPDDAHGQLNRPERHKNYDIHYVHGHTSTKNDPSHVSNLDSLFGKNEEYYTPGSQSARGQVGNVGYRVLRVEAFIAPEEVLKARLADIHSICTKLQSRYSEKMKSYTEGSHAYSIYREKKEVVDQMLKIINGQGDGLLVNDVQKITSLRDSYTKNYNKLEKENDPTSKGLIKALKVLLVSVKAIALKF